MALRISITSTQCAGMTATPRGDAYRWIVTFQFDGDDVQGTAVSLEVVGPQQPVEAQEQAISILRRFTHEAREAAERYEPFCA